METTLVWRVGESWPCLCPGQTVFSPGYRHTLPPPLGGGGGGRRPAGGATRRDLRVPPPCAGRGLAPLPGPTPRMIATTVHCPGEPGDTPRPPEPTWGFNRACTSPIANPERSAPMVAFTPMGASPLPCPTPRGDSHHGPLPRASLGNRCFHAYSLSRSHAKDAKFGCWTV